MPQGDPFPLDRCSGRLRNAILTEFQGRCPTLQEVASVPHSTWMTVPGIGETLLMELETLIQGLHGEAQAKGASRRRLSDAELLKRLERLQRDFNLLRRDVQVLLNKASLREPASNEVNGTRLEIGL
jgi:hypothetical protein